MTPIEQYEAQQRALETERAARINADLQRDVMSVPSSNNPYSNTTNTWPTLKHARYGQLRTMTDDELFEFNHPSRIKNSYNDKQPEAAPFCAPYGEKDAEPGALVWLWRVLFVVVLAAAFYTVARWVMP